MVSKGETKVVDVVQDVDNESPQPNMDDLIEELITLKSSLPLTPKSPDKCPVFCCFYAEFDIKTGPVVRYQSPANFMERDIHTTTGEIHVILRDTFERFQNNQKSGESKTSDDNIPGDHSSVATRSMNSTGETMTGETTALDNETTTRRDTEHTARKTFVYDGSTSSDNQTHEVGQSFFDSTSEYIITGSELTGKIITLSTHDVHVMTRPTQISSERYERNALLFSIGMVLRRAADPRPFRPLISKLAMTLRSMEIETGVLSNPIKVDRILQPLLEHILLSMNSPRWECNLLLDKSTALNLKLFHPPKPPVSPVHDYHVPVLLVRDFQLGYYEWDLAINWVILHIDGITNARQISVKAEVDLEMVLACLRVLRHHNVIEVIDMFVYTNRYECTERAAAMLAGKDEKLMQEAVDFAAKRSNQQGIHLVPPPIPSPRTLPPVGSGGGSDVGNSTDSPKSVSPYYFSGNSVRSPGANPSSSYPPRSLNLLGGVSGSHRSSTFRHAMMAASSLEREQTLFLEGGQRYQEERRHLKAALAELYCACNRNLSFGDLWLSLTAEVPSSLEVPMPNLNNSAAGQRLSSNFQRSVNIRKDSLTEYDMSENEVVAFSPMESSYLDSLRHRPSSFDDKTSRNNNNGKTSVSSSAPNPTNWNEIFKEFDHRRFITFGVVNGLLNRVHSYPFFPGPFPDRRRNSRFDPGSTLVIPPESTRKHKKKEQLEEKSFQLAKSVSTMMDGTRFDDELVCAFEKPFNVLVDLVEKYSGKKVAHIFARGDSCG